MGEGVKLLIHFARDLCTVVGAAVLILALFLAGIAALCTAWDWLLNAMWEAHDARAERLREKQRAGREALATATMKESKP